MAEKKYYYYVLVFTEGGPVFVTSQDYSTKTAYWNKDKEPKEFTMTRADDLVFGLRCNGFGAVTVKSPIEIDSHPYRYSEWEIDWKKRERSEEDD